MRTFANKPGVVFDADKTTVIFAEDMNEISGELEKIPRTLYDETDGATVTFDVDTNGTFQRVVLGGNRTLAVTNSTLQPFALVLKQDATGTRTVTWFSGISWAGGSAPTLTTTPNKTDTFVFIPLGSNTYLGFVAGQNS